MATGRFLLSIVFGITIKNMKTQIIYLSTGNTQLKGRYRNGYHVKIICDATNGSFTINLPDCGNNDNTHFSFIRKDEDRTSFVYLVPELKKMQKIKNEDIQKLRVGSTATLQTDGKNWYTE